MMQMTGAQLMVRLLERQARTVAGIPGGALPFYDALSGKRSIYHVLARHEQGAGFIAQGWRASRACRRYASPRAARARPTWSPRSPTPVSTPSRWSSSPARCRRR